MSESKGFGYQAKSAGSAPVEPVAEDGTVESEGMGGVDAQLMGASAERDETHVHGAVCIVRNLLKKRPRTLPILKIHHLARPVIVVRKQRKTHFPALGDRRGAVPG